MLWLPLLLLLPFHSSGAAPPPSKAEIRCGACAYLITEAEAAIAAADQSRKVKVGSFRVGPDGKQQYLQEVAWPRSEQHLHEVAEEVCAKSSDYALATHPKHRRRVAVKTSEGGRTRKLIAKDASSSTQGRLNFACQEILEEEEEAFIQFLKSATPEPAVRFCVDEIAHCTAADLEPFAVEFEPEPTPPPPPQAEADVSEGEAKNASDSAAPDPATSDSESDSETDSDASLPSTPQTPPPKPEL